MMQDLISVIIPVYKAELFLERCVRSILAQTHKNLEIILVDDGSPDRSGEICDQLAQENTSITVYHTKNGGAADARNHGTTRANGAYIAFVDADDYLAPNYLAYLLELIKKYDADTSCCCMVMTESDSANFGPNPALPEEQALTGTETCYRLYGDLYSLLVTPCGNLYKSEIVKRYLFPVGHTNEDEANTCKYYYASKTVAIGNQRLYAYYQNPNSVTHTFGTKLNTDAIWALEHRADFFESCNEQDLAQKFRGTLVWYCIKDSLNNNGRCDQILKDLAKKPLSARTRLVLGVYNFSPALYKKLLNIRLSLRRKQ